MEGVRGVASWGRWGREGREHLLRVRECHVVGGVVGVAEGREAVGVEPQVELVILAAPALVAGGRCGEY